MSFNRSLIACLGFVLISMSGCHTDSYCRINEDCTHLMGGGYCINHLCQEQTDSLVCRDCNKPYDVCYPNEELCIHACLIDDDCGEWGVCSQGECITFECYDNDDCKDGKVCDKHGACCYHLCDNECVDLDNDPANCGSCGNTCSDGNNCVDGECMGSGCSDGQTLCGEECVYLNSADHCGACDHRCGTDQICNGVECVCSQVDLTLCSDKCVDIDSDSANCGSCGNRCTDGQKCENGACISIKCTTDVDCGNGRFCVKGECVSSECSEGKTFCAQAGCVNLKIHYEHCGSCGNRCGFLEKCSEGECIDLLGCKTDADCTGGYECCYGQCLSKGSSICN